MQTTVYPQACVYKYKGHNILMICKRNVSTAYKQRQLNKFKALLDTTPTNLTIRKASLSLHATPRQTVK